ncbi:MAG: hypothetical protein A2190_10320 [Lysobacterales bacterium RIFOXYA1_FULL_69_10]|nr:MAG: hypothetical protein A2190_10320 [Xanthomonadales bacterium RIFOXYA1_FULL_69_10]
MAPVPRRPMFWLLAVATLAIAGWGLWPRAQEVEIATVDRGPLEVVFTEEARTRLVDRWTISAPTAGLLERISVEPGDAVTRGQVLARLHPATTPLLDAGAEAQARAQLSSAQQAERAAAAAVDAARASVDAAGAEFARLQALAGDRLVAASSVDAARERDTAARTGLRAAIAREASARADRQAAAALLANAGHDSPAAPLDLRAPVDGRVIRLHQQSEVPVQPGQPLLDIGNPDALEAVSELLTTEAMRLPPGAPVQLDAGDAAAPLTATLERVEPGAFTKVSALGVEEQRVLAVITLPEGMVPPTWGDGFRLDARFIAWRGDYVLRVPTAALVRDGDAWAVFAIDGRRARLRRIRLGHMGETMAEVAGGLGGGDRVVVYPGETLKDGSRVTYPSDSR